jgi:hypothetical protein
MLLGWCCSADTSPTGGADRSAIRTDLLCLRLCANGTTRRCCFVLLISV